MTVATRAPAADRFALLDRIRELPTLPQVLVGVSRIASDPTSDAADLASVILKDQALTMKVLRMANSARYAISVQRVTTVSRAVVILGFESVRALALGLGAYQLLSTLKRGGGVLRGFWTDAVATAVLAQDVAELLDYEVPEEAFVAGLLHDVGKLVLAEHDPRVAAGVYGTGLHGPELLAAETRAFGVNHVEVGTELARRWELPEVLVRAIRRHHQSFTAPPPEQGDRLSFLVAVGKALAEPLWQGSEAPRNLAAAMARVLRKPPGVLLQTLHAAPGRIEAYARFFDLKVEDLETYTLWVEQENHRLHEVFAGHEEARRRSERREAELAAVREIHGLILQGVDPDAVVRRVLRACLRVAGARRAAALGVGGDPPHLRPLAGEGDVTPSFLQGLGLRVGPAGALGHVVGRARVVSVLDKALPYFRRLLTPDEARAFDAPAFVLLPLAARGRVTGVLYADRGEGEDAFSDDDIETLATLGDLIPLALEARH